MTRGTASGARRGRVPRTPRVPGPNGGGGNPLTPVRCFVILGGLKFQIRSNLGCLRSLPRPASQLFVLLSIAEVRAVSTRPWVCGALLLALSACQQAAPSSHQPPESKGTFRRSITPSAPRMTKAELRAVPESVVIDGVRVRMIARLWRDLQPSNNYDPATYVMAECARGGPDGSLPYLAPDAMWLIVQDSVWMPEPIAVLGGREGCEVYGSIPPRLPDRTFATVVVRLRGADSTTYLVRSPSTEVMVPE